MTNEDFNILVVDDKHGIRRLLYEVLAGEGYMVATASDGREALRNISVKRPDIVLLDYKMPVLTGIETLAELRKTDPDLNVVMITASGETEIMKEAGKLGVKHYIAKPFDLNELRALVKGMLMQSAAGEKQVQTG